jgi:ADP-heptose:LPS heptosyltransferase
VGVGDEIMATAWARKAKAENPDSFVFLGNEKRCDWSAVFENNPNISHPKWLKTALNARKAVFVPHHVGNRPYIRQKDAISVEWNPNHRAEPGQIFLTEQERQWADDQGRGYVLIEPHIKGSFGGNKAWLWSRWCELVERLAGWDIRQNNPMGKKLVPGTKALPSSDLRKMLASVVNARLVITTDSALHHAAAALGVPAVVMWGARIPPDILGYEGHENLYTGDGEYCGLCVPCPHCEAGMKRITVDMVEEAARRVLERG